MADAKRPRHIYAELQQQQKHRQILWERIVREAADFMNWDTTSFVFTDASRPLQSVPQESHESPLMTLIRQQKSPWDNAIPSDADNVLSLNLIDNPSEQPSAREELKRKRARQAISLHTKLEILDVWDRTHSMPTLMRQFCIPRGTLSGIIKDKERLLQHAKHMDQNQRQGQSVIPRVMVSSRIVESRFKVLEELLAAWFYHLQSRFIPVSNKKMTGQALEIHRMLSGLLAAPMPPCKFTSSWLKGFKRRRNIPLEAAQLNLISTNDHDWAYKSVRWAIEGYDQEDIYSCDVASLFSRMMPLSLFQDDGQSGPAAGVDATSVSVLLCCNVMGTAKREPLILVRQSPKTCATENGGDKETGVSLEDLTGSTFENWLTDFDMMLTHNAALLIDEAMWRFLRMGRAVSSLPLRFLKIVPVSSPLSVLLPMSAKITKDFKAYYHMLLIDMFKNKNAAPGQEQSRTDASNQTDDLLLIRQAWCSVERTTIQSCFQRFLVSINPTLIVQDLVERETGVLKGDPTEAKLIMTLKSAIPNVPLSVIQYYATQDMYTGPSSFLRTRIQGMQKHPDYESCFNKVKFGSVMFGSKEPQGRTRMARYKSVKRTFPPPSRRSQARSDFPLYSQLNYINLDRAQHGTVGHERAGVIYMLRTLT
ncbi:Tigger transposable element-derived protein 6 [Mortierella claussenii]|nr:Tigger transposable element-derived protein 6 [Mortierella claussenii]